MLTEKTKHQILIDDAIEKIVSVVRYLRDEDFEKVIEEAVEQERLRRYNRTDAEHALDIEIGDRILNRIGQQSYQL
jgi:hypothetical protein